MALPLTPAATGDRQAGEALRLALVADLDAGFAEVVHAYERVVYSVALRLSSRPADAEDLAAEAFLHAYRALRGYHAEQIATLALRPWLLTILRNVARNAVRDAARRPAPPPAFEPAERPVSGPSVEQQIEQDDAQRELGAVLAQLPETQRTAVVLRHVVGLPTSEVAEVLGCPDGTAKSHISRGLQRLRALLTEQADSSLLTPGKDSSMMINYIGSVEDALAGLTVPAAPGLANRIFGSWLAAPSRLGEVFVAFTDDGVQFLRSAESVRDDAGAFAEAYRDRFGRPLRQADRAPAGLLPALRGIPAASLQLDLRGLSDFERDVLTAARRIPAGQTRPYSWIAHEAGRPRAVRAVGSALGRNPVPLLIPCHRVVRADGQLGDYMFGPAHKEELLRAEQANIDELAALARQGMHFLASDTTRVVCYPTCHHARRITPTHRHPFPNITAALSAGYHPCKHCRPAHSAGSAG